MKKLLIALAFVTLAGGVVYVFTPDSEDTALTLDHALASGAKQVTEIRSFDDVTEFALTPANTRIDFSCAKNIGGKTLLVRGGWSNRFGSKLIGKAIVDNDLHQVEQIEVQIDISTLWTEHDMLTAALLTKGFFHVQEHPTATFISTAISPNPPEQSAMESPTHLLEGNLNLNGIEKSIIFPVQIDCTDSELVINSEFSLNRKDFDVNFSDAAGFGLLTDENISRLVALHLSVDAKADRDSRQIQAETEISLEQEIEPIDVAKLANSYTETIPATLVSFDMVLVPGDRREGIPSLYFGIHEVTWDEFMPWVEGRDIEDNYKVGELRALKLRPSSPYGSVDRNFGMDRRPVLGVSRRSAELYCQWLSEQTRKKYRLPTEKEWEHAYRAGGGSTDSPPSVELALRRAVYKENSFDESAFGWATKPVGSTEPDEVGLYDMAGNVCEWVTGTGEDRVVRGGHFESPRDELGVGRYVEVPDWNRDDPSEPDSIWWFVNAPWAGFRVVGEIAVSN